MGLDGSGGGHLPLTSALRVRLPLPGLFPLPLPPHLTRPPSQQDHSVSLGDSETYLARRQTRQSCRVSHESSDVPEGHEEFRFLLLSREKGGGVQVWGGKNAQEQAADESAVRQRDDGRDHPIVCTHSPFPRLVTKLPPVPPFLFEIPTGLKMGLGVWGAW
mmetsp:Transcript_37459/g.73708  ORF Transcript_37459/g.73708 Transcript_37459/m.73708 type:complete len:161 (-) Transcript_37459:211-693(-)